MRFLRLFFLIAISVGFWAQAGAATLVGDGSTSATLSPTPSPTDRPTTCLLDLAPAYDLLPFPAPIEVAVGSIFNLTFTEGGCTSWCGTCLTVGFQTDPWDATVRLRALRAGETDVTMVAMPFSLPGNESRRSTAHIIVREAVTPTPTASPMATGTSETMTPTTTISPTPTLTPTDTPTSTPLPTEPPPSPTATPSPTPVAAVVSTTLLRGDPSQADSDFTILVAVTSNPTGLTPIAASLRVHYPAETLEFVVAREAQLGTPIAGPETTTTLAGLPSHYRNISTFSNFGNADSTPVVFEVTFRTKAAVPYAEHGIVVGGDPRASAAMIDAGTRAIPLVFANPRDQGTPTPCAPYTAPGLSCSAIPESLVVDLGTTFTIDYECICRPNVCGRCDWNGWFLADWDEAVLEEIGWQGQHYAFPYTATHLSFRAISVGESTVHWYADSDDEYSGHAFTRVVVRDPAAPTPTVTPTELPTVTPTRTPIPTPTPAAIVRPRILSGQYYWDWVMTVRVEIPVNPTGLTPMAASFRVYYDPRSLEFYSVADGQLGTVLAGPETTTTLGMQGMPSHYRNIATFSNFGNSDPTPVAMDITFHVKADADLRAQPLVVADDPRTVGPLIDRNTVPIPHVFDNSQIYGVECSPDSGSPPMWSADPERVTVDIGETFSITYSMGCAPHPCGCAPFDYAFLEWDPTLVEETRGQPPYLVVGSGSSVSFRALRGGEGTIYLTPATVDPGGPAQTRVTVRPANPGPTVSPTEPPPTPTDTPTTATMTPEPTQTFAPPSPTPCATDGPPPADCNETASILTVDVGDEFDVAFDCTSCPPNECHACETYFYIGNWNSAYLTEISGAQPPGSAYIYGTRLRFQALRPGETEVTVSGANYNPYHWSRRGRTRIVIREAAPTPTATDSATTPTATPSPEATQWVTPLPTATLTPIPEPTTPAPTPTSTPEATAVPTDTDTPTPTATPIGCTGQKFIAVNPGAVFDVNFECRCTADDPDSCIAGYRATWDSQFLESVDGIEPSQLLHTTTLRLRALDTPSQYTGTYVTFAAVDADGLVVGQPASTEVIIQWIPRTIDPTLVAASPTPTPTASPTPTYSPTPTPSAVIRVIAMGGYWPVAGSEAALHVVVSSNPTGQIPARASFRAYYPADTMELIDAPRQQLGDTAMGPERLSDNPAMPSHYRNISALGDPTSALAKPVIFDLTFRIKVVSANPFSLVVIRDDPDASPTLIDVNSVAIPHVFSTDGSWDGVLTPTPTPTAIPPSPTEYPTPCATHGAPAPDCRLVPELTTLNVGESVTINSDCECPPNECGRCDGYYHHFYWDASVLSGTDSIYDSHIVLTAIAPGRSTVDLWVEGGWGGGNSTGARVIVSSPTPSPTPTPSPEPTPSPTPRPEDIPVISAIIGQTEATEDLDRNGDGVLDAADLN